MAALHRAAKLGGDGLLAIADGEDRQAGVENFLRRAGRAGLGDGGRAAGQDHGFGLDGVEGLFRRLERRDLAIDARLAHAARDELGHLRAEIDNENLVVVLADFVVQKSHGKGPVRDVPIKASLPTKQGAVFSAERRETPPEVEKEQK